MPQPIRLLLPPLLLVLPALACGGPESAAPPVSDLFRLAYPTGVVGDLPTCPLGGSSLVAVVVTDRRGHPTPGIEVTWDGGAFPTPVLPQVTPSDSVGQAATTWTYRLHTGAQRIHAYLPGAVGSPIEYRCQVVRPSK